MLNVVHWIIILLQCGQDLNGHCYCWFVYFHQSVPEHVSICWWENPNEEHKRWNCHLWSKGENLLNCGSATSSSPQTVSLQACTCTSELNSTHLLETIQGMAGVILLLFLIKPLHLIGVWFNEQNHEGTCLKDIGLSLLNSEHNWEDLCIQLRNQQTCKFDKSREVQFTTQFFLMLHCRFANATQVSLCESNR